jgi:hypothetical protein
METSVETIEAGLRSNPRLVAHQKQTLPLSMQNFLTEWDTQYKKSISEVPLFNTTPNTVWSPEKKQFFCKLFYHARGHLSDFLWYLGNIAPNLECKELILYNYREEFGGYSPSHETLYFYFTQDMGVPSPEEVTNPLYYLPFLKKFNADHVKFLKKNTWESCLGAYAAYERLDNLDYANFLTLAKNLQASSKGLLFFKVHSEVEHFTATTVLLVKAWEKNEEQVKQAFHFIAKHQSAMWEKFSEMMTNYPGLML